MSRRWSQKWQRFSIYIRSIKIFNILQSAGLQSLSVDNITPSQNSVFVHKFKKSFLVNNAELVKIIFQQ